MATEMEKSQAVAKRTHAMRTLSDMLHKYKEKIALALPKHMSVERMFRVVMTSVQQNPKLQECNPLSVVFAVMEAAQLGLEPNSVLGSAYLAPFKSKGEYVCRLMTGYQGLIDLARRSGSIKSIEGHAVYEGDVWEYEFGLNPKLRQIPLAKNRSRNTLTHAWALARLVDGGHQMDVMDKEDIEQVRMMSQNADSGPWSSHYSSMAIKSVIRRLCKFLPLSAVIREQTNREEMAEAGVSWTGDLFVGPEQEPKQAA